MPTITINLSAAAAKRLRATIEESLGPRDNDGELRPATLDDAKTYIIGDLKQMIRSSEKRRAEREAAASGGPVPTIT